MEKKLQVKVCLKEQNEKIHNLKLTKDGTNFYMVKCFDEKNNEMGQITFKIENGKTWLYKIETNEKYAHQGVGTALLQTMEYVSIKSGSNLIEGKYYPENEHAKGFYLKYGYFIPNQKGGWDDYDETWTMHKMLDSKKIEEEIAPNIVFKQEKTSEIEREM